MTCFPFHMGAQNLVINGSFEEVIECPEVLGDIANTVGWFGSILDPEIPLNENPSPDWFHECSDSEGLAPPSLVFGIHQYPLTGEGC